jgi:hypothetical protein
MFADDDGGGGGNNNDEDDEYERYKRSRQPQPKQQPVATFRKPAQPRRRHEEEDDQDGRYNNDDEEEVYTGRPRRPVQKKQVRRDDYDDDGDDGGGDILQSNRGRDRGRNNTRTNIPRNVNYTNDNGNGNEEVPSIRQNGMLKSVKFNRGKTIPYDVQQAAKLLLDTYASSAAAAQLMTGRLDDGLEVIAGTACDLAVIDPYVVLRTSRQVRNYTIVLKEVVPVSTFLLACVLKLTYHVPFSDASAEYDPETIQVRPFKGVVSSVGAQTFGCVEEVDAIMQEDATYASLLPQFTAYMKSLSALSPAEVCEESWIAQTLEKFGKIMDGTLVVLKPQKEAPLE